MVDTVQDPAGAKGSAELGVLKFGGFTFDPFRGILRQPTGKEVTLRPKSAELLHLLACNATHVVARSTLMDAVWPGVIVNDDGITQCVAEIRRALGSEGAALLRTLPKRGYLLDTAVTLGKPLPLERVSLANKDLKHTAAASQETGLVTGGPGSKRRRMAWLGASLTVAILTAILASQSPLPPAAPRQTASSAGTLASTEQVVNLRTRRRAMLILPFISVSGEVALDGLADAITEELIAGFGNLHAYRIIGRSTAFTYRGRMPDLRQLGHELNVRFVIDGTLRRSGEQVVISLHLQETSSGTQLWADRFELPLADPVELPRLVFARIQRNLAREMDTFESQHSPAVNSNQLDVTDLLIRGNAAWGGQNNRETLAAVRALFAQAAALDETSVAAQTFLGRVLVQSARNGFSVDVEADLAAGEWHLARALVLNPQFSMAHYWRGLALHMRSRFDEALAEYNVMIALKRNVPRALGGRGAVMLATDRFEEAIAESREAIRISPDDPSLATWLFQIGMAARQLGREEEALGYFIRAVSLRPTEEAFLASLVSTYGTLGRQDEAGASLREWRERQPDLTVAHFRRLDSMRSPYPRSYHGLSHFIEGLRIAGMPEE